MSKWTIGNFEIDTLKAFTALQSAGVSKEEDLKKLDLNGDSKISEDELVELLSDEDDNSSSSSSSSSSSVSDSEQLVLNQLQMYDELNLQLEERLNSLYSDLASSSDLDDTDSIMQEIQTVQNQINQNMNAVYSMLVQQENQAAAAANAATSSVDGVNAVNGYSGLTTGTGISGGTAFGNTIVSIAQSYVGKLKESDGSYLKVTGGRQEAWCADFVTYVVKQACSQTGTSLNGFGSPSVSNLQAWGKANGCYIDVAGSSNRAQTIVQNVQPGDVMIQKSNGASHTGIVTKVYSDGSFDTIEGNTSDQCLARHYDASSSKLSGFVKIT